MSKFRTTETPFAFLAAPLLRVQPSPRRGKSGRNLIFPAAVKARPQFYACARKAFAKRRSRQNLLNTLSFPHNKNFPPGRGFISKGAYETRGNRLQNALFMRIVRAGTNFFLYRPHYPLPPHSITAPLVVRTYSALARVIYFTTTGLSFRLLFRFRFRARVRSLSRVAHVLFLL